MNDNIEKYLCQRIEALTAEVQVLVAQTGAENKPNKKLLALIAEIDDLNNQLEFVVAVVAAQNDNSDLVATQDYVYEDDDDDDEIPPPPVLRRQIAVIDWDVRV